VAQALNLLGVIAFNTSRYDEAVSYYEQGAFLRQRERDQNALAGSYNNLALAHQAKGEYDKALEHLHKSIDIKRQQNNEAGIAGGTSTSPCSTSGSASTKRNDAAARPAHKPALGLAQLVAGNQPARRHRAHARPARRGGDLLPARARARAASLHRERGDGCPEAPRQAVPAQGPPR
jgi:tetratricopeptide (TPR) repeat protein